MTQVAPLDDVDNVTALHPSVRPKFAIDQADFAAVLKRVTRVSSRSFDNYAAGLRLSLDHDDLSLTATDGDLVLAASVPVSGSQNGWVVAPAKLLCDLVSSFPQEAIQVGAKADRLTLASNQCSYALALLPDDSVRTPEAPEGFSADVDAAVLAVAIANVHRAASRDDARPALSGVLFDAVDDSRVNLVATDSYQLCVEGLEIDPRTVLGERDRVLVPAAALRELSHLIESTDDPTVTLRLGDQTASFTVAGVTVGTRLIEADYPEYQRLIPTFTESDDGPTTVDRALMVSALKRVGLIAGDISAVKVAVAHGEAVLTTSNEVGEASERVEADGGEWAANYHPKLLLNALEAHHEADDVELRTTGAKAPLLIHTTDTSAAWLTMPLLD